MGILLLLQEQIINVAKYSVSSGVWTTIAGGQGDGGSALEASINTVSQLLVNHTNDDIFILDSGNIRKIRNGIITLVISELFSSSFAFSPDYSSIYVSSGGTIWLYKNGQKTSVKSGINNNVNTIVVTDNDLQGNLVTVAGKSGVSGKIDGNASIALLNQPSGFVLSNDCEIVLVDAGNNLLRNVSMCDDQSTVCKDGFYGPDCNVTLCYGIFSNDSSICSGNGACNYTGECLCREGFGGQECANVTCYGKMANNACSGNGQCIGANTCLCDT